VGALVGMRPGNEQEEVVYEFVPEPAPPLRQAAGPTGASASPSSRSTGAAASAVGKGNEGIDTNAAPVREAFNTFAQRELEANAAGVVGAARPRHTEYEAFGSAPGWARFEPPEQRLARLQAEVAELLALVEGASMQEGGAGAAELLGAEPAALGAELRVLEQRLGSLARSGPSAWQAPTGAEAIGGPAGGCAMAGSLVHQLEHLAACGGEAATAAGASAVGDGCVTYEISYSPDAGEIAESANIAALESSIAEIERQLGVLEPNCPFSDLQTAVVQLQQRLSLLDTQKLESIRNGVHKVMGDLEQALAKKAELDGNGADPELDRKVSELYEFCHRWSATSASLPAIVSRLQTLQALHQQSATFASRLTALEQQQDELAKLLDVTSRAVQDLGRGLQENMTIVKDNMRSLEEKIIKVLRA